MRGYLIWLIVALACSSMAEDSARAPASDPKKDASTDPATDPAKDLEEYTTEDASKDPAKNPTEAPAKEAFKDPAKDSAKDPAKKALKDPAKDPIKDTAKDASKDPAKNFAEDTAKAPAKDALKDPAKDTEKDASKDPKKEFQQIKSKLKDIIRDIKLEKRWMNHVELMEQRINDFIANTDKEIPKMQTDLLNVRVELAKANVMLERKKLVMEHCPDLEKTKEDIRRIAKERVADKSVDLESEEKEKLRKKYRKIHSLLMEPWNT